LQEAEAAAIAKEAKRAKQADKLAQAAQQSSEVVKSPSGCSCLSYELFVGQAKGNDDNMSLNTLKDIYHSYFHSVMTYGLIYWGNSSYAEKVFKMQKRVI
jgi:hypothetical protein